MFEISMKELKKVFEDFYNVTKFKIVLYDSDRNFLYSYPEEMCTFCKNIRSNPVLEQKCLLCDAKGFDICDEIRKPYVYECNMSVTEAISPIYSGEILVGYLMFGQIICGDKSKVEKKAKKLADSLNIDLSNLKTDDMTTAEEGYINSAVNMMTMCANYLYTNEIIKNSPNLLAYQLKSHIKSHLADSLNISSLCRQFYLSRTKLYKISKQSFGMGISDYICLERMKKAKELLCTAELPVSQIAEAVGISDTNYFIRLFKKHNGTTPLKYRKEKGL